jgi:hypothetical protein
MLVMLFMREIHRHMGPEELERYSLGNSAPAETARVEEHLLVCEQCRCKLEETEGYGIAMKSAAAELRRTGTRRRRIIPAVAAAAGLILAVSVALHWQGDRQSAFPVTLTATRANATVIVPAGRSLELHPDLTGLAVISTWRIEMVDRTGKQVWNGDLISPGASVIVPAQSTGMHYVRMYTPAGELLREFGLQIGN